jgi:hypothetical protein
MSASGPEDAVTVGSDQAADDDRDDLEDGRSLHELGDAVDDDDSGDYPQTGVHDECFPAIVRRWVKEPSGSSCLVGRAGSGLRCASSETGCRLRRYARVVRNRRPGGSIRGDAGEFDSEVVAEVAETGVGGGQADAGGVGRGGDHGAGDGDGDAVLDVDW